MRSISSSFMCAIIRSSSDMWLLEGHKRRRSTRAQGVLSISYERTFILGHLSGTIRSSFTRAWLGRDTRNERYHHHVLMIFSCYVRTPIWNDSVAWLDRDLSNVKWLSCVDDFRLSRFPLYLFPRYIERARTMIAHLSVQEIMYFTVCNCARFAHIITVGSWKTQEKGLHLKQRHSHVFRAHDTRTSSGVSHVLPITPKIAVSCIYAYSRILVSRGSRLCLDLSTKTCSSLVRDRWGLEELDHVIFCYSAQLFLVESNFEVQRSTFTKQSSSIASVSITTDSLEHLKFPNNDRSHNDGDSKVAEHSLSGTASSRMNFSSLKFSNA